ncbi:hypothetical protein NOR51B_2373 [Luminiphilus syltensis NOR5-1B]|uniref:Uncharacterized protein n=1 Tax=Luminiphilus syltensis NOR5-1B TaxID=565045 RepID=B8KVR2_9GAMM|nr:hypothetical protein NOR51B_2373 [Luminiphilus syltensis NOR5-1B]
MGFDQTVLAVSFGLSLLPFNAIFCIGKLGKPAYLIWGLTRRFPCI